MKTVTPKKVVFEVDKGGLRTLSIIVELALESGKLTERLTVERIGEILGAIATAHKELEK